MNFIKSTFAALVLTSLVSCSNDNDRGVEALVNMSNKAHDMLVNKDSKLNIAYSQDAENKLKIEIYAEYNGNKKPRKIGVRYNSDLQIGSSSKTIWIDYNDNQTNYIFDENLESVLKKGIFYNCTAVIQFSDLTEMEGGKVGFFKK